MLKFVLVFILVCYTAEYGVSQSDPCNTFCGREPDSVPNTLKGNPGASGKRGAKGEPGVDCTICDGAVCNEIRQLRRQIDSINTNKARQSCSQIKQDSPDSGDGLYKIRDLNGNEYNAYCDMTTDAGGWTLVASIHENNIGQGNEGKCTAGDRWSSEQGNSAARLSGDGNWQNRNIFGFVTAATSDDYKNPAYFEMGASDVMIWQVPNETPLRHFNTSSYLKYRTTNGFLSQYGGNLFHLYNEYYPIKSNIYNFPNDSGPAIPVVFDLGDSRSLLQHFPPNAKPRIEPGYIQFRAISVHKDAFALCPGIRNKPTFDYPSQSCLGSAGKTQSNVYCGDFSGLVHNGHAFGKGWSADETMITSTFLIFYR